MKRLGLLSLAIVMMGSSCASVNLKAVESPEPTATTEPTRVLGKVITSAAPASSEFEAPSNSDGRPEIDESTSVPVPTSVAEQTRKLPTTSVEAPPESSALADPVVESNVVIEPVDEPAPQPRLVIHQNFEPFGTVGGFTLYHPAKAVELIGFHESNHDGAQQIEPVDAITEMVTMETRDRGNGSRTAADIAVNIASEIRAPVTGTVVRAGTYTLYCQYRDDYVVIAPDAQPTWEVKILHINGVQVRKGDRVVARETVLAPGPTPLPFKSQIDELTVAPAPPHVHIEVVDPSIPDRPGTGGC